MQRRRFATGREARTDTQRTCRIPVRFTLEELVVARQRARAAGRPVARYLRETVLAGTPRTLRLQAHDDVVHTLSAILRQFDAATDDDAAAALARAAIALRALLARLTA